MSVTNHEKPLSLPAEHKPGTEHRQPPYLVTLPETQGHKQLQKKWKLSSRRGRDGEQSLCAKIPTWSC